MTRSWISRWARRALGGRPARSVTVTDTYRPRLEALEDRTVPAAGLTIREATGATAAAIQATVDAFRNDLGTDNGAAPGSQGTGRRQITWDANTALDPLSSPNLLPGDFFNTTSPRGAVFSAPGGNGVVVSQDDNTPADADADQVNFSNINPTYATDFATFSAQRLFAAAGSNVVRVNFFIPGTTTSAVIRGFGAVFSDVDIAGSTRIEYYDINGTELFRRNVLPTAGNATFSFLGVSLNTPQIAFVRIVSGQAALGASVNDVSQGGSSDLVVMDDFIYGEPLALPNSVVAAGSDFGGLPRVQVINGTTGQVRFDFLAYGAGFRGGVRVAVGDVNGDGVKDVVTAAGFGGGPHVEAFNGVDGSLLASFFAYHPNFRGGVNLAVADINGDLADDILVGAGFGGGPHVEVFDIANGPPQLLASFFAFDPRYLGGVTVAGADMNGDGVKDIIVGAEYFASDVIVVNGANIVAQANGQINPMSLVTAFQAFAGNSNASFRSGGNVSAADVNGDLVPDLIVGMAQGAVGLASVINGSTLASLGTVAVGIPSASTGTQVSSANLTGGAFGSQLTFFSTATTIVQAATFPNMTFSNLFSLDASFQSGAFLAFNR